MTREEKEEIVNIIWEEIFKMPLFHDNLSNEEMDIYSKWGNYIPNDLKEQFQKDCLKAESLQESNDKLIKVLEDLKPVFRKWERQFSATYEYQMAKKAKEALEQTKTIRK